MGCIRGPRLHLRQWSREDSMGDRYIIEVKCPSCDTIDLDVYYAPTCDFVTHKCSGCGACIDLVEYTGISYEDASNINLIEAVVKAGG